MRVKDKRLMRIGQFIGLPALAVSLVIRYVIPKDAGLAGLFLDLACWAIVAVGVILIYRACDFKS